MPGDRSNRYPTREDRLYSPLIHWLCCPLCGGHLTALAIEQSAATPGSYVLACDCSEYPVIAGIPIFRKGRIGTAGQTADEVIALLKAGRHRAALLALIAPFSPALAPAWMRRLPAVRGIGRLQNIAHRWALRRWQEGEYWAQLTAWDLFEVYFRRLERVEAYEYFAFRFSQPRYLVALSFASLLHQPTQPVLDLACGFGHLTRSIAQRAGQQVIGVDRNFFALYVAQQWIAPEAAYVCCEADTSLPFPDGTFSAVICSDAFHTFVNKVLCLRELKRVTQTAGLIMLASFRLPSCSLDRSGTPLPPERLRGLVADLPHCLVSDREVLARYLRRQGPPLARSVDIWDLGVDTRLSVVASHRQAVFQDWGPFEEWPHATGPLRVNPLYVEAGRDQRGTVHLRRVFPSVSYEQVHPECKAYLPEAVAVAAHVWADLASGKRTPEVDSLIAQCVVVGVPERYGRRPSA